MCYCLIRARVRGKHPVLERFWEPRHDSGSNPTTKNEPTVCGKRRSVCIRGRWCCFPEGPPQDSGQTSDKASGSVRFLEQWFMMAEIRSSGGVLSPTTRRYPSHCHHYRQHLGRKFQGRMILRSINRGRNSNRGQVALSKRVCSNSSGDLASYRVCVCVCEHANRALLEFAFMLRASEKRFRLPGTLSQV